MLCAARAWRMLAGGATLVVQQPARSERRHLRSTVASAAAAARPPRVGRPSKSAAKHEAKQFQDLARQLTRLTEKQLVRLQPLVGEQVVDAVGLAARISNRNQGRQRQESLVAKLLRESVIATEVTQLQAAVESVRTGQGIIANPAAEQQVQLWLQALLADDVAAATQAFGLAQSSGADLQQIRQLLRQAQQTEVQPPPAATAPPADAAAVPPASRPTAKALSARKQLRKLLQLLAEHAAAKAAEDEQ